MSYSLLRRITGNRGACIKLVIKYAANSRVMVEPITTILASIKIVSRASSRSPAPSLSLVPPCFSIHVAGL